MNAENFNKTVEKQIRHCIEVLEVKAEEYVLGEDRLEHFKNAASENETTPKDALWGMASKHITSLGAMCRTDSKSIALWREKITDAINYLLLLSALLEEENNNA